MYLLNPEISNIRQRDVMKRYMGLENLIQLAPSYTTWCAVTKVMMEWKTV